jgi:hypothetical protein
LHQIQILNDRLKITGGLFMKNKISFLLLILALLEIIISSGCGNNNGITTLPSINTPTNNNTSNCFITFRVEWPKNGKSGKCFISSGSEKNNLIASVTSDTKQVIIKVRKAPLEGQEDNPNIYMEHGFGSILYPAYNEVILGPFPAIEVIVRAEAYSKLGSTSPDNFIIHKRKECN